MTSPTHPTASDVIADIAKASAAQIAAPDTPAPDTPAAAPATAPETASDPYASVDTASLAAEAVKAALAAGEAANAAGETEVSDEPATEAPGGETDGEEELVGDVPALPDGFVAPPVLADGLATEFTLYDEEGAVEVPALMVEYKANGKVRKDRLDVVVRMAQVGAYNEEREQRVKAIEAKAAEAETLFETLAAREEQLERLLSDPDFYARVLAAYEEETTPEKEVARARQETETLRLEHTLAQIQRDGQQFHTQEVAPAIAMIATQLPLVTEAELTDKLEMALLAHAETLPNGVKYVPASRYDDIRQYLVNDLAVWATAQHQRRARTATPAPASPKGTKPAPTPDPALTRAQADAQRAKRQIGKAMQPGGAPAHGTATREAPAPAKEPATIDEAMESALTAALSGMTR